MGPGFGDALGHRRWDPIGVVACITPWNFPLLVTIMKLAPALTAGMQSSTFAERGWNPRSQRGANQDAARAGHIPCGHHRASAAILPLFPRALVLLLRRARACRPWIRAGVMEKTRPIPTQEALHLLSIIITS